MPPRGSTVEDLAARISNAIVSGDLEPGTWLRQEALAQRFGVSRQPIREALRHVQAQGLVRIHHNQGVLVRQATPREVRDAYRVRAELEGLSAELAARRASADELSSIRITEEHYRALAQAYIHGGRPGPSAEERGRANDAFHAAVLTAAGSEVLADTLRRLLLTVPRGVSQTALSNPRVLEGIALDHQRIRDAIECGHEAAARHAMVTHIHKSGELIADRYEASDSHPA